MGAVFRCPVWTVGAEELSALLKKSGIPLYGAALREDTLDARAVDYNRCAIAIGSEGRGLTEGVLALCDPDNQNSHERALRIVERGSGSHGSAVGGRPE